MYSFLYTNKLTKLGKDEYLLHIIFNSDIIQSCFVSFPENTTQEVLDTYANSRIDSIEGSVE